MLLALAGFAAGTLHVLAGPDHLAAVAPLCSGAPRGAWTLGLRWGIAHACSVALVAALALSLRELLPLESLSSWSERVIGLSLCALGLLGLVRLARGRVHAHPHHHGESVHEHPHAHVAHAHGGHEDALAEPAAASARAHRHTAFAFGALHGIAGSSHLAGVLPALALPCDAGALAWLAGFAAGSIAAMCAFAGAVGLAAQGTLALALPALSSGAAFAVGLWWVAAGTT